MLDDLEHFAARASRTRIESKRMILYSKQSAGFSAGADLRELFAPFRKRMRAPQRRACASSWNAFTPCLTRLDMSTLTTIAAVHGVCSRRFELALTCDLIVADKWRASVFPSCALRLIPGFGGIPR